MIRPFVVSDWQIHWLSVNTCCGQLGVAIVGLSLFQLWEYILWYLVGLGQH